MIANAGTAFTKSILDTTVEETEQLFATNYRSTFLAYKYAAKQMIAQGRGGRIIGVSIINSVVIMY
jgi:meso-butanediol dehydrogenase/(S,S)-butanediol dehydrogenase/diacetyl reductase